MEQVRPIRDFILLQPESRPTTTASGLHIPQNVKEKTLRGKVLATGPGRVTDNGVRVESELRAGDRVIYLEYNMAQRVHRIGSDDGPVLLPEHDIIAVLES